MPMNEWIVYNWHNLKCNGFIHDCFSRDVIIRIKYKDKASLVKLFHMDTLDQLFPDFDFGDANEYDNIFLDASKVANDSVQSSY